MGTTIILLAIAALLLWFVMKWPRPQITDDATFRLQGDGTYSFEIVGESFCQDALEEIVGGRDTEGIEFKTSAILSPEPNNPYDKNAVAVLISGQKVGHLSKPNAQLYRSKHGLVRTDCAAMIVGGWDRGKEDRGHFGVKLDIRKKKKGDAFPLMP